MGDRQVNIDLKFNTNAQDLTSLRTALEQVLEKAKVMRETVGDYAIPFEEAATAAKDLLNAMDAAHNTKLNQTDFSKVTKQIKEMYGSTKNFKDVITQAGQTGVDSFNRFQRAILDTYVPLQKTQTLLDKMAVTMGNTIKWGIASSAFNKITSSAQKAYSYVKDLDKSLNDIRIVSNQSAAQMEKFAIQANKAAQALGATTLDYTKGALIYYQQGLSDEEVIKRNDVTVKMSNVLGRSTQEISDYMTAIWNNFYDGSKSLEYYADVLADLGARTASSAEEISQGLEKFAAIGKTVGLSYEYAAAALTTVTDRTRQSAEVVGTAFKTLFARLQGLKLGETLEDGTTVNKYSEALAKVGISIKDQYGELKDMDKIIEEMGAKWKTLSKDQQVALAQTVAGVRQYTQLISWMDNWDFFKQNVDWATNSEGALGKQQSIYLDSIEAKMNELTASIESIWDKLFDEEMFKTFISGLTALSQIVSSFLTALQGGLNQIIYLASFAANIFQNQLGKAITNIQLKEERRQQLEQMSKDYLEAYRNNLDEAYREEETALKTELELLEKILAVKKDMTEEEFIVAREKAKNIAQLSADYEYYQAAYEQASLSNGKTTRAGFGAVEEAAGKGIDYDEEQLAKLTNVQQGLILSATGEEHSAIDYEEFKNFFTERQKAQEYLIGFLQDEDELQLGILEKLKEQVLSEKELEGRTETEKIEQEALTVTIEEQEKAWNQIHDIEEKIRNNTELTADELVLIQQVVDKTNTKYEAQLRYNTQLKAAAADLKKNGTQILKDKEAELTLEKSELSYMIKRNGQVAEASGMVSALSTSLTSLTSVIGGIKTLFDPDLSGWEKFSSLLTLFAVQGGIIAANWKRIRDYGSDLLAIQTAENMKGLARLAQTQQISAEQGLQLLQQGALSAVQQDMLIAKAKQMLIDKKILEENTTLTGEEILQLAVKEKLVLIDEKTTGEELKQLMLHHGISAQLIKETVMLKVKNVLQGVQNILVAIENFLRGNIVALIVLAVAATAAAIAGVVYIIQNWTSEQAKLKKHVQETAEAVQKARDAYQELSDTINNYTDARKKIDELTEGTIEFYEAIIKSNEEAQKLIDTLGLMAGKGYTIDSNGLIQIDEGVLSNALYRQQQEIYRSQASNNTANAELEKYYRDEIVRKFQKDVNKAALEQGRISYITKEQAEAMLTQTGTPDINGTITSGIGDLQNVFQTGAYEIISTMVAETTGVRETFDAGTIKISRAIETYLPQYKDSTAKIESYQMQAAKNNIYGYLDRDTISKYNQLSSGSQSAIDKIISRENDNLGGTTKGSKPTSATLYNDNFKFMGTDMYNLVENGKWYDPRAWGAKLGNWIMGDPIGKLREEYAINALGYTKNDKTGAWYTPEGAPIKADDLKKELKDAFNIYNAVNAHNQGDYFTSDNYTRYVQPTLDKGKTLAQQNNLNSSQSAYLTEALLRLQAGTFDDEFAKLLTNQEKEILQKNQGQKWFTENTYKNDKLIKSEQKSVNTVQGVEVADNISQDQLNTWLKLNDETGRSIERIRADLVEYNSILSENAKSLGTSKEALEFYGIAMYNASKETNQMDKASAEAVVDQYKFNKAYNASVKVYEDNKDAIKAYGKAIKNGEEISYDMADAMGELSKSLKEMGLSLSAETITDHLDTINTLLTGNKKEAEKAYKALLKLAQLDTLKNFFGEETSDQLKKYGYTYEDLVNAINNTEPGTTLEQKYADALGKMIEDTNLTVSQINELADGLNITIPVQYDVPEELKMKDTEITTKATSVLHRYTGEMPNPSYDPSVQGSQKTFTIDYSWVETTEDKTDHFLHPDTTNFTVNSDSRSIGGNRNMTKSPSKSSSKGGGGSSKKKEDKIKNEIDRYHKVNTQIEKVSNTLEDLEKEEERTLNPKLLENYKKQWEEINTQLGNYVEKLKIAQGEYNELYDKLAKQGVTFNEDGTVANYFEILKIKEKEVNAEIEKFNNMSAKQQEKYQKTLDKKKEDFEQFKTDIDRIDEMASSFIPELKQQIRDAIDKKIEIAVKDFDIKVNLSTDIKDLTIQVNDFINKTVDRLNDNDIFGNFILNQKNISSLLGGSPDTLTGNVIDLVEYLKAAQEQYDKMSDSATIYGDDSAKAYEHNKEALEKLIDGYTQLMDYQKDQLELIRNQNELINTTVDNIIDKYDKIGDQIEHDKKYLQLVYGEGAASKLNKLYDLQVKNRRKQLEALKAARDESQANLDAQNALLEPIKAQLRSLEEQGLTETDLYKQTRSHYYDLEQARDEAFNRTQDLTEQLKANLETSIDEINEKMLNAIDTAIEALNNGLTESGFGLDFAKRQWELIDEEAKIYIDTINRLQGENNIESKYLESIEKATNPRNQKKLKDIMDAELKALREKDKLTQYDLDRAEKKYQIALAQLALEEAQQNKNKMRLRRDSQGNYRYQYVADEDNVKKAEEELTKLYTDLYNFDKARFLEVNGTILGIEENTQNQIREIYADTTKSKEEKDAEAAMVVKSYNNQILAWQQELAAAELNVNESAFLDLEALYGADSEKYAEACADKAKTMAELIPQFESEGHAIATNTELAAANEEAFGKAQEAANAAAQEIQHNLDLLNNSLKDLENAIDEDIDTISEAIDEETQKVITYREELIKMNADFADNEALLKSLRNEKDIIGLVAAEYEKLKNAKQAIIDQHDQQVEENDGEPIYTVGNDEYDKAVEEGINGAYNPIPETVGGDTNTNTNTETYPYGKASATSGTIKSGSKGNAVKAIQYALNKLGYGNSGTNPVDGVFGSKTASAVKSFQKAMGISADGAVGKNTRAKFAAKGYDTGGYTGSWGNDGRLAFLHQKELVLNAQDTENILNTVAIMRNLMASMNQDILSRLAGVSAGTVTNLSGGNTGLEQNVHIDANFPNATNSSEIEEALRNLVNVASQRITK